MWFDKRCRSQVKLTGKTALITGGNSGIGKETAKDFYKRGARVLILCRNQETAKSAVKEIKNDCLGLKNLGEIVIKKLDLGDLSSIRKCAEDILQTEERINLLVNNAGVMCIPECKTKDGFETHFGVNHLGHFLLTLLLLPLIIRSAPARIVSVSSLSNKFPYMGRTIHIDDVNFEKRSYSQLKAYGQSKLANIIFTKELARRLREKDINNVNVYSLHPGFVATDIGRNFNALIPGSTWLWNKFKAILFKTPEMGAQTTIYCAVDESVENENGLYYSNCGISSPTSIANDEEVARKLWDLSVKMVKLDKYDPFNPGITTKTTNYNNKQ